MNTTQRAVLIRAYGGAAELAEIGRPAAAGQGQVLVRVRAAGVMARTMPTGRRSPDRHDSCSNINSEYRLVDPRIKAA